MNPSSSPTPSTLARATAFFQHARPLEQALFAFHFSHGTPESARSALQAFQNADGGFQGLEADIGFPASTVLSTCHALHLFHEVGTPAAYPAVQRALDYLRATYDESRGVWPIIPPHDNSQPHAPWWHYSDKFDEGWNGYLDNPRPDVLAVLLTFPSEQTRQLVAQVTQATLARLHEKQDAIEMNGLLCYLRLHSAPNLPPKLNEELNRVLPRSITQIVERDPTQWHGYRLRPLDVAPRSESPWRPLLVTEIDANLDFLIQTQAVDGSWSPHWNWGDSFPNAWPAAKLKWQAVLTLANLRILRSYGRL